MQRAEAQKGRRGRSSNWRSVGLRGDGITRTRTRGNVLGISFDGLKISGIVNELLHLGLVLNGSGFRIAIDLGFDIALRPVSGDPPQLPDWVEVVRSLGEPLPSIYGRDIVTQAAKAVARGEPIAGSRFEQISQQLADGFVATLSNREIDFLLVENGTLPDNPIVTEALYIAIAEYGARRNLGKFVIWRDWDLMWSSEPQRYGRYPFLGVRKPHSSEHIHFAVANEWMRKRMRAWASGVDYHVIPSRFILLDPTFQKDAFRDAFSIPADASLIARCTRVIPQKCIERDLRLVRLLQDNFDRNCRGRRAVLFVTGVLDEDPNETARLAQLQRELRLANHVVWGRGLEPLDPRLRQQPRGFSIQHLLEAADVSSFMTSFDYEGFGNPPGEAMATGVPFIATTYELYHDVYGSRGAIAPLLPIDRTSSPSDPIPDTFVDAVIYLLSDKDHQARVVAHNREVVRRHFSMEALTAQVRQILNL